MSEQRVKERKQEKVSNNRITRESDQRRIAADAVNACWFGRACSRARSRALGWSLASALQRAAAQVTQRRPARA